MANLKTHSNRAIDLLTDIGWLSDVVERKQGKFISKDWLGFADIIAIDPDGDGTSLALQVTSANNVAARVGKMNNEPNVANVLKCGWRVEVWGIRDTPDRHGSYLKARTFKLEDDGSVRVVEGSLVIEV